MGRRRWTADQKFAIVLQDIKGRNPEYLGEESEDKRKRQPGMIYRFCK